MAKAPVAMKKAVAKKAAPKVVKKHYVLVELYRDDDEFGPLSVELCDFDAEIFDDLEAAKAAAAHHGTDWAVAEIVLMTKAPPKPVVEFVPYA